MVGQMSFRRLVLVAVVPAFAAPVAAQAPAPVIVSQPTEGACPIAQEDLRWIGDAFGAWRFAATTKLKFPDPRTPHIVFFDARCTYTFEGGQGFLMQAAAAPHGGNVRIPSGEDIPVSVVSFASPGKDNSPAFFVMSLPSIWEAEGVDSALGIETLATGVLLHEMMHAWQFGYANPRLQALAQRYNLPDDISDDSLQAAFRDNPRYVATYREETDLLYRAAAATSDDEARRLAGTALKKMRHRRATFFKGKNERWAPLDEVFLTMEGLGQWTMYAWLTDPRGRNLDPASAQREVRRGDKHWSQEQGLALFLVIDRLVPDWQNLAFAEEPETVEVLLARAARQPERPMR
jgi:hypothetical protein